MCRPEVFDPHVQCAPFNSGLSLELDENVVDSHTSFNNTHNDTNITTICINSHDEDTNV